MKTSKNDGLNDPYLSPLVDKWGWEKLEIVTNETRTTMYQWKPSRGAVPVEPAMRICAQPDAKALGFVLEAMCPEYPWAILYAGYGRRVIDPTKPVRLDVLIPAKVVKEIGATEVSRWAPRAVYDPENPDAIGRTRQNVYEALRKDRCPVWLAFAIERASGGRYQVEDFRPSLPWHQLYNRRQEVQPVRRKERETQ